MPILHWPGVIIPGQFGPIKRVFIEHLFSLWRTSAISCTGIPSVIQTMSSMPASIDSKIVLKPNDRFVIPCGISISLPKNVEGQVRPRSGLAAKHGITVLNTPGTIDSDFRGEIKVILINLGKEDFTISQNDRIAQIVFSNIVKVKFEEIDVLDDTERGSGGFGSTGK